MKIVVTVKQVPDPDIPPSHFKVDEAAGRVVPPSGVAPVVNGYDLNALEAAIKLKESNGAEVVALSLGAAEARDALKRAIAMGATSAVLVSDPALANADSRATAQALASAIRKVGDVDLVMSGRQASDSDAGQVPLGIAELLGLPAVSPIRKLELTEAGVRVERIVEDGYQVVEAPLPCVVAVSSEIGEPRYPPLKGIMAAGRAQIPVWSISDLGLDAANLAPRRIQQRLYVESREASVELVEADTPEEAGERLALKLREAKLI
ncbi:MAG: electron transfer flavoprotein subunit beta/FixA family protein [Chloroflexi bacterium]|nr:electron transfer flavoprotein subunit beta/FixA family protein [Chloroflexota bacterium]